MYCFLNQYRMIAKRKYFMSVGFSFFYQNWSATLVDDNKHRTISSDWQPIAFVVLPIYCSFDIIHYACLNGPCRNLINAPLFSGHLHMTTPFWSCSQNIRYISNIRPRPKQSTLNYILLMQDQVLPWCRTSQWSQCQSSVNIILNAKQIQPITASSIFAAFPFTELHLLGGHSVRKWISQSDPCKETPVLLHSLTYNLPDGQILI